MNNALDIIWNGIANKAQHLYGLVASAGSEFSFTSLTCALLIAAGFTAYGRLRQRRRLRLRVLVRALFPKRILRHPSTVADIGYFLFNTCVYGAIFGMASISYEFLTNGVLRGLIAVGGPVTPSALPSFAQNCIVTAMLFLAYEFGYWLDHYLKHRIPVLWEVHKVHHSAEVLTPLTLARMHPLDTVIFGNILAVTAALTNGVVAYLFGDTSHQYALSGNNIILVAFIHIYTHLQHTHIWIAFRGVLGRLFVSPAHHQIHHSTNPAHFNKNLGSCLAIWDWMFGTLHIPAKKREKLTFGVEPQPERPHSVTSEFITPFERVLLIMAGWFRPRRTPQQATPEAAPR